MSAQGGSWQKDAADQNFDYMFKLLIIGNSSVGKTSFLFRYADDSFTSAFVSTVGIDFKVKTVFRQDKRVKLQIWVSFNYKISIIFTKYFVKFIFTKSSFSRKGIFKRMYTILAPICLRDFQFLFLIQVIYSKF